VKTALGLRETDSRHCSKSCTEYWAYWCAQNHISLSRPVSVLHCSIQNSTYTQRSSRKSFDSQCKNAHNSVISSTAHRKQAGVDKACSYINSCDMNEAELSNNMLLLVCLLLSAKFVFFSLHAFLPVFVLCVSSYITTTMRNCEFVTKLN